MLKHIILSTLLPVLFLSSSFKPAAQNDGLTWYTNIDEAQAVSQKEGKPIFAFFTGSDWCGWCMRLQSNVFHKPEFTEWAEENVVLLELDFPRRKQLPEKIANQNNQLRSFFKVAGYPTVWIFNMTPNQETKQFEISALGSLGYPRSQPGKEAETFIVNANNILANVPQ